MLATLTFAAVLSAACGGSDDDTSSGSGTTTSRLSAAYKTQCARCHGADGQGSGQYPKLPGDVTSEAAYIAQVRGGSPNNDPPMDPFPASKISDDDLKKDYAYFSSR